MIHEKSGGRIRVGAANSPYLYSLVEASPDTFDYVEISYEQILADGEVLHRFAGFPMILHCASLSISSPGSPDPSVLDDVCASESSQSAKPHG